MAGTYPKGANLMLAATPIRKSKITSPKVSQRVGKSQSKSKKKEYRAEPVPWQEKQHYEFAFDKWLEENAGKETRNLYRALFEISIYSQHGIGPNGHKAVRRARNVLKKHLPKFNPKDWTK